jgi:hypothetical protein
MKVYWLDLDTPDTQALMVVVVVVPELEELA